MSASTRHPLLGDPLLEGQTLRQRLPRKGIPWQKVVEIGAGIAEGLAAAHGKGIVHRDLKPESIFVTSDGRVKVLDFGLARIETEISQEAETATLTPAETVTGTIMGTPGYMAPEQVRGKVADHGSDIFALGCVLYEMVFGRRAFGGDTTPDTMAAILKEEPPRPSATGAAVPMATPTGEVRPVPRRWWPVAVAVGAVLAGASLVAWLNLRSGEESIVEAPAHMQASPGPFLDEWRVAVEPFDNRTGDPALDPIGRTLTDRLMEGLARIDQGIESLTPITVLAADASGVEGSLDEKLSQKIGRLLVTGSYSEKAPAFEVIVQVRDPDTRGVLYSTGSIVVSRSVGDAELTPLLEKVMGAVGIQVHIRLENVSHIPDYTVFREYIGGLEGLWSRRDPKQADRIDRAIEMDPEFLEPVFWKTGSALVRSRPEEAAPLIDHIRLRLHRLTEHENLCLTMFEAEFDEAPARAIRSARNLQTVAPNDFLVRFYRARAEATHMGVPRARTVRGDAGAGPPAAAREPGRDPDVRVRGQRPGGARPTRRARRDSRGMRRGARRRVRRGLCPGPGELEPGGVRTSRGGTELRPARGRNLQHKDQGERGHRLRRCLSVHPPWRRALGRV
jgi:serine/threonine protein kinase